MKVAIIGAGQIAYAHLEELNKIESVKVAAICDLYKSPLDALSKKFGIDRTFTDFKEMLSAAKPDVVHITTPPASHFELAKQAVEAGCHVYVEKPFTVTLAETEDLIDFANRKKVLLCVGTNHVFAKAQYAAAQKIRQGEVGRLTHIETVFSYNLKGDFARAFISNPEHWVVKLPGQLFQNVISHPLAAIVPFLGDDFEVKAWASDFSGNGIVKDELRLGLFDVKNRITASVVFTANSKPEIFRIGYYGTEKSLYVDNIANILIIDETPLIPTALGRLFKLRKTIKHIKREFRGLLKGYLTGSEQYYSDMNKLFRAFYDSIEHDVPLPISYDEIRRTSKIMDEMARQVNK